MTTVLAAIAAIGTIIGGAVYLVKYASWIFVKTPEQKKEDIDHAQEEAQKLEQKSGRPG